MKRKLIVALMASLTLTLGTAGTVIAAPDLSTATAQTTEERPGYIWIVDKEAVYETIHHDAVYETVHHDAEYKTVHYDAVTDTIEHPGESHIEYVEHPEEFHYEWKWIYQCNGCKIKFLTYEEISKHMKDQMLAGHLECGGYSEFKENVKIVDKEAWDEQVLVKEAWDEQVLVSPEEGHWEKVESEDPDQPKNPADSNQPDDSEEPVQPDDLEISEPDTNTPSTPVTPGSENEGTDSITSGTNNSQTAENKKTQNKTIKITKEDKSDEGESSVPKTGDAATASYLITLAGGTLIGGSTLVWRIKRRK